MIIAVNTVCEMCKDVHDEVYMASSGKYLCESCMRKFNPPRMTLISYTPGQSIFNVEVGKYEKIKTVELFELCGWFRRSLQTSVAGHVHRTTLKVHYLEYYGDQACCRCKEYAYFDRFATKCVHEKCIDFAVKRKPEDRNYPAKGSKYYEYLKRSKT